MVQGKKCILGKIIIPDNYFMNMNFDSAISYNKHSVWKNETHTSPVELFVDKIYTKVNLPNPEKNMIYKKDGLNNLVCNLINGIEKGRLIKLWRTRGAYTMPKTYGMPHYSYQNIIGAFDWLRKLEYADMKLGYYDRAKDKGKITRIWATEKLKDALNELSIISYALSENISTYFDPNAVNISSNNFSKILYQNPIILKDSNKIRIEYRITKKILALKKFLHLYNEFISSFDVVLPITIRSKEQYYYSSCSNLIRNYEDTDISGIPLLGQQTTNYLYSKQLDCNLYRVFNNSRFNEGGRFYGGDYQLLSEMKRAEILINNLPVVEIDFSGLHGRMIYQYYEKVDYREDPYANKNYDELRPAFKTMFQMCINATGRKASIGAFNKSLIDDEDGWELKKVMNRFNASAEWLYDTLLRKHERINHHFSTGVGIKLQYVDSMIAESVLKHFTHREIPCLPIHDSFIVPENYKDELIEVMKREYKRIVGFDCKLKINGKEEE